MRNYYCMNPIAQVGLDNFSKNYIKTDEITEAEGILVRSASMHEMELPDGLLAVARAGAGVNNIPLEKCAEKGIVVFNTPGANANGVKELVIAGMLLASRDVVSGINWVKENQEDENIAKDAEKAKKKFAGTEVMGKRLGIIGLGAIGVKVANVARHLGMEVLGYDPYVSVDAAWKLSRDVRHVLDVNEIYEQCDYITIHVPLMDSTKNMISAEAISRMKDGVILLNFARDLLVDEEAVLDGITAAKSAVTFRISRIRSRQESRAASSSRIWALRPRSRKKTVRLWQSDSCRNISKTEIFSTASTSRTAIWVCARQKVES